MKKWEYQITRYHTEDFSRGEDVTEKAFYCDQKGQCFLHDTSRAAADMVRDTLNEEGKKGWELVQFGYHRNELMCIWKRAAADL
ncbi:MAG: hypothetical protein HXY45_22350 [Syntrophaceae bacterium]|jgi:hypothetical protein|nr:hypothetical protein [Syntrophaceae bacterium]